ncbi:MAG: hypothetical protein NVV70_06490 [Cellulomonas sp.]|uniref:hypothetical protein n=1 Tax=Cellulomonas sp. TaxID=40001 RepID=UPI0025901865|nr:hypothetical protein [Cellulomonas sp.]MCR6647792.1 hypothetical protein [Cellulomonas sp.]MCR6703150.1 hypothetical protein [Cellulomonas sp.]
MSPSITRVPAAAAALVALAGAIEDGLQVVDGPFVGELGENVLVVGFPEGGNAAYDATVTKQPGMGRPRLQESWTIHCLLSRTSGQIALGSLRDSCAQTLAALDEALREHVVEDDAWQSAALSGAMQWLPINGPHGSSCNVIFDVVGTSLL